MGVWEKGTFLGAVVRVGEEGEGKRIPSSGPTGSSIPSLLLERLEEAGASAESTRGARKGRGQGGGPGKGGAQAKLVGCAQALGIEVCLVASGKEGHG